MDKPTILMVDDGTLFRTMLAFKEQGGLVALHAENGDVIDVLVRQAVAAGKVAPKYHAVARPPILEAEAVHRAICIAEVAESSALRWSHNRGGTARQYHGRCCGTCQERTGSHP